MAPSSSTSATPDQLRKYSASHKYSQEELVKLFEYRNHSLYWQVCKLQYPNLYAQKNKIMDASAKQTANSIGGTVKETNKEGDCMLELLLLDKHGNLPSGQQCQLLRIDIVDLMIENKEHMDIIK